MPSNMPQLWPFCRPKWAKPAPPLDLTHSLPLNRGRLRISCPFPVRGPIGSRGHLGNEVHMPELLLKNADHILTMDDQRRELAEQYRWVDQAKLRIEIFLRPEGNQGHECGENA